jgi:hypothetical protein
MLQVARRNKWAVASIIAAAAMGGTAASQSEAKLVIDLKAIGFVGGPQAGQSISADGKTVTGATVGTQINYRVTGQVVFAGDTDPDGQDDIIQSVEGVIASNAGSSVQVNLTHAVNRTSPSRFNATGSGNGTPTNLGGDTDIDIGPSLTPQNGTSGNINYRNNGADGIDTVANLYNLNSAATDTTAGSSTITVVGSGTTDALINWTTAAVFGVGGQPQWTENGVVKNQVNGDTIEIGAPIKVLPGVPEPTSLGLLGLGALGLMRRRRA